MKRVVVLVVLLCLLGIVEAHSQQDPVRHADFSFVLQYGSSGELILDTLKGTFTRDADRPKETLTVALKLTPDEMDEVFKGLARIDFWNHTKYPKVFSPPPPAPGQRVTRVTPCGLYVFSATSNGQIKALRWEDCFLSFSPAYDAPADELRGLFRTIHRFVESKPEYKALPRSQVPRPI